VFSCRVINRPPEKKNNCLARASKIGMRAQLGQCSKSEKKKTHEKPAKEQCNAGTKKKSAEEVWWRFHRKSLGEREGGNNAPYLQVKRPGGGERGLWGARLKRRGRKNKRRLGLWGLGGKKKGLTGLGGKRGRGGHPNARQGPFPKKTKQGKVPGREGFLRKEDGGEIGGRRSRQEPWEFAAGAKWAAVGGMWGNKRGRHSVLAG